MARTSTTEPPIGRVDEEEELQDVAGDDSDDDGGEVGKVTKRVSRLAFEGGDAGVHRGGCRDRDAYKIVGGGSGGVRSNGREDRGRGGAAGGRTLPPPHAWLAVEDTKQSYGSDTEEQWTRLLRGGAAAAAAASQGPPRRSSFSVVRQERATREAWLDRAWEMKRSWHERNGGAPDAGTPVVVVVGKCPASSSPKFPNAGGGGGGGVAMDMEEVRACRDLGLELPSDCTVEIQCYGLSAGSCPTHTSSGAGSPSAATSSVPSRGEDPVDVKARLKVWAQAVALASTTHLGS